MHTVASITTATSTSISVKPPRRTPLLHLIAQLDGLSAAHYGHVEATARHQRVQRVRGVGDVCDAYAVYRAYHVALRDADEYTDDEIDESGLPAAAEGSLGDRTMTDGGYTLSFDGTDGWSVGLYSPDGVLLFGEDLPAKLYVNSGGAQALEAKYDGVEQKSYGFLATAHLTSEAGSKFTVEDRYYFPAEGEEGVFNVARTVTAESVAGKRFRL